MRLAVTFCLTLATGLVESRPSTLPADVSEVSCQSPVFEHNSQTNDVV
jgi:hypothetical protein